MSVKRWNQVARVALEVAAASGYHQKWQRLVEGDREAVLVDLLTDLRHFCANHNLDFDAANETASRHYQAEKKS